MAADEGLLARHAAELLGEAGVEGRFVDFEPGREQYVARTGGSTPLTFTGHLDIVPVTPGRTGRQTRSQRRPTGTGWSVAEPAT